MPSNPLTSGDAMKSKNGVAIEQTAKYQVKLGKGKGDPAGYVAIVQPGQVLFEVDGILESEAREALRKAGAKLPVRTKFIAREH